MNNVKGSKPKVLLELRPAMDGFAGIPQETRLLFSILKSLDNIEVEGMIQTSGGPFLLPALKENDRVFKMDYSQARAINKMSRTVLSVYEKPEITKFEKIQEYIRKKMTARIMFYLSLLKMSKIKLTKLDGQKFHNFIWTKLFSKSLTSDKYDLVTKGNFAVNTVPWHVMHTAGILSLNYFKSPVFPYLDTKGYDIFISQTPYPARLHRGTLHIVRYHDAIPITHPHFISDKARHQAHHFNALLSNVKSGAYFCCVSDFTRQQLLSIFPEVEKKAFVIHNIVSPFYFYDENSDSSLVPDIIHSRINLQKEECYPKFLNNKEKELFYQKKLFSKPFKYLLIVSTVEPRKNHARLLSAWEMLRAKGYKDLKLIVVGDLGWDYDLIMKKFRSWIDMGEVFFLNKVPATDLRVLYKFAEATVCPSFVEGFDFSGVEAMRCGGVVVASDIPVHREIYKDACIYFNPYSTVSTAQAIKLVIDNKGIKEELIQKGFKVADLYTYESIMPQWQELTEKLLANKEVYLKNKIKIKQVFQPVKNY